MERQLMSSNKKMLNGALMVATGTALLVGGFGSFALWSEQDPLPNAPISTGELSLQTQSESWVDESPDAATTTWDPATDELVPGDTVTLTVPLSVTAVGKNLAGTIHLDRAAFDTTGFGPNFTVTYDVTPTPEAGVTHEVDGSVSFLRSAMTDDTVEAEGRVTFALSSAASLSEAEDANAVLSDVEFVTTQVRPTEQP
jgi:alternate signal-mediated exported protein